MRLLFLLLFLLAGLIQYPLWMGKGGWLNVWDLRKQVAQQHAVNDNMRARNAAMQAEVQSLRSGTDAIEERARGELGMLRDGEIFVEIAPPPGTNVSGNAQAAAGAGVNANASNANVNTNANNATAARNAPAVPTATQPATPSAVPARPVASAPARPATPANSAAANPSQSRR